MIRYVEIVKILIKDSLLELNSKNYIKTIAFHLAYKYKQLVIV